MDIFANLENTAAITPNPMELFGQWLSDAEKTEINDPNAMSLATVDANGRPSVRIVLLKGWDERGFVFYTNRESRKGMALAANPVAALCFHWKSLLRQICIEGDVTKVSDAESDAYYASRPAGSRIGAWASLQSRPLESRSVLTTRIGEIEGRFRGNPDIPRPPHWGGYRIVPQKIEFWHDGQSRLHTRVVYEKIANGWSRHMLYP